MDGYPSLSTNIFLVSTEFSISAALHVPFRQFAISCTFHSGRWSARSILYLVRTLFHCFQYTARILWRSHSSVVSIRLVEDTFRQAILRYGKFDACYFDNGSQYIARQIRLSLSRLGIRVLHAKPRSGKSKGKIEKFHQVVDMFNREAKLKNIKTLEELNRLWAVFLDAYYHQKPHEGISEYYESLGAAVPESGITPLQEWNRDSRPLTYLDVSVVSEAFLHHETRKVDKGACISFRGRKYETKPALIGYKVEISYDPAAPETITVSYPGYEPFTAQPVRIGEFCDKNPTLPAAMQEQTPTTSRFLDALEKKHSESTRQMADAISFASYRKEVDDHV